MNVVLKYGLAGTAAVFLLGGALAIGAANQSTEKLAAGIMMSGVDVGGLTRAEAQQKLSQSILAPKVTIKSKDKQWTVDATELGWRLNDQEALNQAEQATQQRSFLERVGNVFGSQTERTFSVTTTVDSAQATKTLQRLTASVGTQPKAATIGFDPKKFRYVITEADVPGQRPDIHRAVNQYAQHPQTTTLELPMIEWKSPQSAEALKPLLDKGNAMIRPLTLSLERSSQAVTLSPNQVANLYWVKPEGIVFDQAALRKTMIHIKNHIDRPARNARYVWKGNAYVPLAGQEGHIMTHEAADLLKEALQDPSQKRVLLPAVNTSPKLNMAELPDIKNLQLIARGESTYTGSSSERRTNVANAAHKIDGAVVPAGEVFSFLESLGSITPENGFVGGLIISGGRTVDGLGGGVCQVSTTAFRALYNAGLPVIERNQHSYRVKYYEPQVGFEAAVYDPGVDLKLSNDTGGTIMVKTTNYPKQSRLVIEVWGTVKPQREVSVSRATILSRTPHPPARWVHNPKLRAGQVKQVDWAQDGYNLFITRTIKDAKGTRTDRTSTNYKPWQAVYERGS